MFITIEQIKAARALLKWNQKDLAAHAGLHDDQVHSFESGRTRSLEVLEAVYKTFLDHGLEFANDGVSRRQINVVRYNGADGFRHFMDDVYATAKNVGGNICLFNGVPAQLQKWLGQEWYDMHAQRMRDIKDNFYFRVIVREGDAAMIGRSFAEYRWFPEKMFNERTIYVYGNKIAFLSFGKNDVRILALHQDEIADSFRVLFDIAWNQVAKPIPEK